jgi:hypothetical protein
VAGGIKSVEETKIDIASHRTKDLNGVKRSNYCITRVKEEDYLYPDIDPFI